MRSPQPTSVKRLLSGIWHDCRQSAGLTGCLVAVSVIMIGRISVEITTSTLGGWTALFFLAIFLGLMVANVRGKRPFASLIQMLGMLAGAIASALTLLLLEHSLSAAGQTGLAVAGTILLISILGFRERSTTTHAFREKSLASWALRLDDLLKYDLPREIRARLVMLIDQLWQSPEEHSDFIPAQNAEFDLLLDELEFSVRFPDSEITLNCINELTRCLDERNRLLNSPIDISYRKIGSDPLLPSSSLSASSPHTSETH